MSQFILFTLISEIKTREVFSLITEVKHNRDFLSNIAFKLFKKVERVYTIPDFENVCIETQKSMLDIPFRKTLLSAILNDLKDNEIFFWYSSDYDDLDEISDFNTLQKEVETNLIESITEIYIHYLPVNTLN